MDFKDNKKNEEIIERSDAEKTTDKKTANSFFSKIGNGFKKVGLTVFSWVKRMFCGASKEISDEKKFEVEQIVSPTAQVIKNFFRKPLAVISLIIVVGMFLFVFIGPVITNIDLSYTEGYHVNIAPGYNFMKVPSKLAKNTKSISSYSFFSVGVDNNGEMYVWGNTKMPTAADKSDMSKLPEELKGKKIAFAAAGYDHAIAITEDGKVVGWGEYDCGQYGDKGSLANMVSKVYKMPDELMNGKINPDEVEQLVCGYQVSAIVMKSGKVYAWGNYSGASNLRALNSQRDVKKVEFLRGKCVALKNDGTVWFGSAKSAFETLEIVEDGKTKFVNLNEYLADRKVEQIASTATALGMVLDDGELVIAGLFTPTKTDFVNVPDFADDENIIGIDGGTKHFTVLTSKGNIYSFGENYLGQCKSPKGTFSADDKLFVGAFQNYVVSADNVLKNKWGCKGYLFGTDDMGRDVFNRIMHGGKMTMTIGAVAVIISTVIAIIVGCLSGYFGGWVDMLLMRITEIFSAIPFLPFALILSAVLAGSNLSEDTRIFMIMVILGLLSWTGLARMIRGQVLAEREKEFVIAAKAMGVKEGKIAFKHILPNVISVILVSVTLDFAGCMLTESSLSYLGFGVKLPRPTWGNMLDGCNNELVIGTLWWRWLFPALFLLVTTIAINIIGDTLRDVLDPKSSSER